MKSDNENSQNSLIFRDKDSKLKIDILVIPYQIMGVATITVFSLY
jgi:hypothetical protein